MAPLGSSFDLALGQFEQFFLLKTKREWRERNGILEGSTDSGSGSASGSAAFEYTPTHKGNREKPGPVW